MVKLMPSGCCRIKPLGQPNVVQVSYNNVSGPAYSDKYQENQARQDTGQKKKNSKKKLNTLSADRRADMQKKHQPAT